MVYFQAENRKQKRTFVRKLLFWAPAVTVLMYLTGLYLLFYPLRIFIYPIASLISLYCSAMENTAAFFSRLDGIMLSVDYSFTVFFLIPVTLLMLIVPAVSKYMRKFVIITAAAVFAVFISVIGIYTAYDKGNTYFSYIPDGVNDGFVVKAEGRALICDISTGAYSYIYNLTDEVASMHVCEIDTLMLTHYHSKHVSLLERLAQREILKNVVLPEPVDERESGIYASLLESAALYGVNTVFIPAGESFEFAGTEITPLDRTYLSRSTHPITAVQIDLCGKSAVIVSCSFNQSTEAVADAVSNADYVIFGGHSPVYKKAFDTDLSGAKAVVVSDGAADWMSEYTAATVNQDMYYRSPEAFRLKISRKNEAATEAVLRETAS